MSTAAARDVLAERERQQTIEGYSSEHDDMHDGGELAAAASAYALLAADVLHPYSCGDAGFMETPPPIWPAPWPWKPCDPRRALVKAGALILAQIEQIDRSELKAGACCDKEGFRTVP